MPRRRDNRRETRGRIGRERTRLVAVRHLTELWLQAMENASPVPMVSSFPSWIGRRRRAESPAVHERTAPGLQRVRGIAGDASVVKKVVPACSDAPAVPGLLGQSQIRNAF